MVALLVFAGCKDTDNASKWVGTYIGTTGGIHGNTFNQIIISESNQSTIRIACDTLLPSTAVYTYAVLQNASVLSTTSATFSETDSVLGYIHPMLLSGTATLNGNSLTFQGYGISAYDTISYYFQGTKQ